LCVSVFPSLQPHQQWHFLFFFFIIIFLLFFKSICFFFLFFELCSSVQRKLCE
jgi:hypothetical protein